MQWTKWILLIFCRGRSIYVIELKYFF
jgi:hypothetical protein